MGDDNIFDKIVEAYEKWFKRNDKLLESELNAVKQVLPTSGKGIEIGVGTGIFASKLGIRDGVEPSPQMAAIARDRGVHVYEGEAEKLPIDNESYQFAVMITIDCYLGDVSKAFSEVRRILVKDGIFIIAFLDLATTLGQYYEENKHLHESYKDANFHTAEEIIKLLEDTGFLILEKKQTIYSLENTLQEVKNGVGEGLFAVIKAKKQNSKYSNNY